MASLDLESDSKVLAPFFQEANSRRIVSDSDFGDYVCDYFQSCFKKMFSSDEAIEKRHLWAYCFMKYLTDVNW